MEIHAGPCAAQPSWKLSGKRSEHGAGKCPASKSWAVEWEASCKELQKDEVIKQQMKLRVNKSKVMSRVEKESKL